MAWNFDQIIAYGRNFLSGYPDHELAFVLSEWTPENGLALTENYPSTLVDIPPVEAADLSSRWAREIWLDTGSGYQQLIDMPGLVRLGQGVVNNLNDGTGPSMVIAGWSAKGIAAGYIVATGATLDQINADRISGLALIRTYVNADDSEIQPLDPSDPFTQAQVGFLSTWLNEYSITNADFAALFGVSGVELADWLKTHPRKQFAQVVHDRFA